MIGCVHRSGDQAALINPGLASDPEVAFFINLWGGVWHESSDRRAVLPDRTTIMFLKQAERGGMEKNGAIQPNCWNDCYILTSFPDLLEAWLCKTTLYVSCMLQGLLATWCEGQPLVHSDLHLCASAVNIQNPSKIAVSWSPWKYSLKVSIKFIYNAACDRA